MEATGFGLMQQRLLNGDGNPCCPCFSKGYVIFLKFLENVSLSAAQKEPQWRSRFGLHFSKICYYEKNTHCCRVPCCSAIFFADCGRRGAGSASPAWRLSASVRKVQAQGLCSSWCPLPGS